MTTLNKVWVAFRNKMPIVLTFIVYNGFLLQNLFNMSLLLKRCENK